MSTTLNARAAASLALLAVSLSSAVPALAETAARPAWVARSDENARVLIEVLARFGPETASRFGVEGHDTEVLDLKPEVFERTQQALGEAQKTLESRLAAEKEEPVRQDLEILVQSVKEDREGAELQRRHEVPYVNVPQVIFFGLRALLDDQVEAKRRANAVTRLRRYAGLEAGYTPILELAAARTRERLAMPGLLGPAKAEIEKDLGNTAFFIDGLGPLFAKYGLKGHEPALARLKTQVAAYDEFRKRELLPRARTDFRLPPDLYAFQLRQWGVTDVTPAALAARARVAFMEIRNEMKAIAPLVAREKGLSVTDYREVIRELKKQQITGEAILPHYQARLKQLEEIIARERVVTLPTRPARIRLATLAESAQIPAPNMSPPRLVGNTGEMGEFVLPLRVPTGAPGAAGEVKGFDDFTFDAASWTLTVHEARPGHELQFASLVEKGVSLARAVFAFNSVNVEGWALYSEAEMKPYLPWDGQLVALQHRMMRAARAFLDPELQMGLVAPEDAVRFLQEEVVLSEPMARQEVERYTFRAPGQATSYFHGYTRFMELKSRVELLLGPKFDRMRYHDFVLAQGLLPPDLLAKAVMEVFVPGVTGTKAADADPASRVHAAVRKIMDANEGRALFSELYNRDDLPADEREYASRLYEVFFALPAHLASEQRATGRVPALTDLADNFGLRRDAVDLLLDVAARDPRMPKTRLFERPDPDGEIASLDLAAIDAFTAAKGEVKVSGFVGQPFPDFSLAALGGDGTISASALRGHPTAVFLWLTRCPVCRRMTPSVVELERKYRERGLKVVGLCADEAFGLNVPAEERAAWIRDQGIVYRNALLDGAGRRAFGNQNVFPTFFLLDRDAKVARVLINPPDLAAIERALLPLISSGP
jgi:thiol-disulfide isomerase/thioredoxin